MRAHTQVPERFDQDFPTVLILSVCYVVSCSKALEVEAETPL